MSKLRWLQSAGILEFWQSLRRKYKKESESYSYRGLGLDTSLVAMFWIQMAGGGVSVFSFILELMGKIILLTARGVMTVVFRSLKLWSRGIRFHIKFI